MRNSQNDRNGSTSPALGGDMTLFSGFISGRTGNPTPVICPYWSPVAGVGLWRCWRWSGHKFTSTHKTTYSWRSYAEKPTSATVDQALRTARLETHSERGSAIQDQRHHRRLTLVPPNPKRFLGNGRFSPVVAAFRKKQANKQEKKKRLGCFAARGGDGDAGHREARRDLSQCQNSLLGSGNSTTCVSEVLNVDVNEAAQCDATTRTQTAELEWRLILRTWEKKVGSSRSKTAQAVGATKLDAAPTPPALWVAMARTQTSEGTLP